MTQAAPATDLPAETGTGRDGPGHERVIWGVAPSDLHDLLWASRCVQVVRPGSGPDSVEKGPALYLLLDRQQLVMSSLAPVLKRMHWASPRLVRLRINIRSKSEYTERVGESDGTTRFERAYGHRVRRSDRAWLTADIAIARAWATTYDRTEGRKKIRSLVTRDQMLSMAIDGRSASEAGESVDDWLDLAIDQWRRPNAVIPGIYEYQPGVWVHESTDLGPGVRVVGSVWIGAGVRVPQNAVIVGPVIFEDGLGAADRPAVSAPAGVDWDLTRSPHWSLPGLVRGGSLRRLWKRAFDIVFSLCVLCATLPFYPFVMLAIWLEDGRPFFFAHTRQTLGGRGFPCLKFRTMRKDAEQIKAQLAKKNAADGPQFFMEHDPRVTSVGRMLRKYQIDELPQFLNVLAGHMSVVGPRPSPDKENQFCPTWREARLSVRPGITGLWQVRRTREPQTDFQEWIRYDLEYVQHQSFVGDLRIIIDTVKHIIT